MASETRDTIQWTLTTFLAALTIAGLAVRYLLMPYLRDHLVKPVEQVRKQVSENGHANEEPTVLDRIAEVKEDVAGVKTDIGAVVRVVDEHLAYSDRWTHLMERELDQLRRETGEEHT